MTSVLALSGGVGGAKLALGLNQRLAPADLTVIVNTGDDQNHYGLFVSPDIDTLIYTLAGVNNKAQGWGMADESWQCMDALKKLGGETWFQLGDKDIATHLMRATLLSEGKTLTQVTQALCDAYGVKCRLLPMSDEIVSTQVEVIDENQTTTLLAFHDYFVKYQCKPEVSAIYFEHAEQARISKDVQRAVTEADQLIVCPSNPFLSIDPIFSVPELKASLVAGIEKRLVVSPIIGGEAVKGPSAKIMKELGLPVTTLAVAEKYQDFATHFVIDHKDVAEKPAIEALGLNVLVTKTLMQSDADKKQLADDVLAFLGDEGCAL